MFVADLMLGCGVELTGARGLGAVTAGIKVAMLLSGTRMQSGVGGARVLPPGEEPHEYSCPGLSA